MARTNKKNRAVSMADSPSPYRPVEERKTGPFDEYEVRSALETITRSIKIRKNSALMRAIRAEARRQLAAAESTKNALSGE